MKSILGLLFVSLFIVGCKKGDEDPYLSLLSRKNRICGEWKLSAINSSFNYSDNSGYQSNGTSIYENGQIIESNVNSSYSIETIKTIEDYSLTINKDGTWSIYQKYDVQNSFSYFNSIEISVYKRTVVETGTWAFLNKTKNEYENKERILFNLTESVSNSDAGTITYISPTDTIIEPTYPSEYKKTNSKGEIRFVFDLLMLKSKEMKWISANNQISMSNYTELDSNYSDVSNYINYETINWTAK